MASFDLRSVTSGEFVLHFGGRPNEVDAFTFANSLLAFSEAVRAINKQTNPDVKIEIAIDAVGVGSFRAKLKTSATKISGLFKEKSADVIVGLFVAMIYEKAFAPETKIVVNDDSYIVQRGDDRIILPRSSYEAAKKLSNPQEIEDHISRAFDVLDNDDSVADFAVTDAVVAENPIARIPRERFPAMSEPRTLVQLNDPSVRIVKEDAKLVVLRAVLERSQRKWQFVWHGIKISAVIKHDEFFDKLARHEYEFGQGDILHVTLAIYQSRDEMSGVYINQKYEVEEVHGHERGPKQLGLDLQ